MVLKRRMFVTIKWVRFSLALPIDRRRYITFLTQSVQKMHTYELETATKRRSTRLHWSASNGLVTFFWLLSSVIILEFLFRSLHRAYSYEPHRPILCCSHRGVCWLPMAVLGKYLYLCEWIDQVHLRPVYLRRMEYIDVHCIFFMRNDDNFLNHFTLR